MFNSDALYSVADSDCCLESDPVPMPLTVLRVAASRLAR